MAHVERKVRRKIFKRDNYTCQLCGYRPDNIPEEWDGRQILGTLKTRKSGLEPFSGLLDKHYSNILTIDHIFEKCLGGSNRQSNLQVACMRCNSTKSTEISKLIKQIHHAISVVGGDHQDGRVIALQVLKFDIPEWA